MDNETKLLPCPFCGDPDCEESESAVPTINGGKKRAVYCNGCFCEGPTADTTEAAIVKWNARASAPQTREGEPVKWKKCQSPTSSGCYFATCSCPSPEGAYLGVGETIVGRTQANTAPFTLATAPTALLAEKDKRYEDYRKTAMAELSYWKERHIEAEMRAERAEAQLAAIAQQPTIGKCAIAPGRNDSFYYPPYPVLVPVIDGATIMSMDGTELIVRPKI